MLVAIDSGARLWEASGIWSSSARQSFYGWTPRIKIAGWLTLLLLLVLMVPFVLLLTGVGSFPAPRLATGLAVLVVATLAVGVAIFRVRPFAGKRRAEG